MKKRSTGFRSVTSTGGQALVLNKVTPSYAYVPCFDKENKCFERFTVSLVNHGEKYECSCWSGYQLKWKWMFGGDQDRGKFMSPPPAAPVLRAFLFFFIFFKQFPCLAVLLEKSTKLILLSVFLSNLVWAMCECCNYTELCADAEKN